MNNPEKSNIEQPSPEVCVQYNDEDELNLLDLLPVLLK